MEDEFDHDGRGASAWGAAAPVGSLGDWQRGLKQGLSSSISDDNILQVKIG